MKRLNKRGKRWLIALATIVVGFVIVFFANSGIDTASQEERDFAATQDAQTVLDFALVGEYDTNNTGLVERVLGKETLDDFQNDLKKDIKKTFSNNAAIAEEVEFNNQVYKRDDILNELVDRYLATVWSDKDYSIDDIEYDRQGNTIVKYSVNPIDINQVQQDVQLTVNSLVNSYYPEGVDRPTQPKMTLIELVLMTEEWDNIVKEGNLSNNQKVTGSFNMNFNRNFSDPYFNIDSGEITKILNSGITVSQKGN